jgi:agmatine/peptidylarginine deiminase
VTNRSLACLLASTGRVAEAEQPASEAVVQLEGLLAEDLDNSPAFAELIYANRNLGLILAMLGRDGTEQLRRSISQTSMFVSQFPGNIEVGEFLVDSYQILAEILWRQGRFSQAEQACRQSIEEIDGMLERFYDFSARDGRTLRRFKYRQAMDMAQANLARFQRKPEAHPPSADSWKWSPLHQLPGRLLQADLLIQGTLPGEFDRQDAFLMTWLDEEWCQGTLLKMVVETHQHAQIVILVENELIEADAKRVLRTAGVAPERVVFCHVPTDTLWIRDYGPMAIDTGDGTSQTVAPRCQFNLANLRLENLYAPMAVSRVLEIPVVSAPFFLEGGEVLSNGEGLCLVSAALVKKNLQVGYSESHITDTIKRLFGAKQIVFLEPLHDEPTGHIDWFATFTSSDTVVIGDYREGDPVNARLLDEHAERLASVKTAKGQLKVVRIPMPPRSERCFGGTYTNVVFVNGTLLVPSYPEVSGDLEREALEVFRQLLPDWKIVAIDCSEFMSRHGALHCAMANLHRLPPPWSARTAEDSVPLATNPLWADDS